MATPESTTSTNSTDVHHVSIKMPPFWREDPKLWFHQLEAQFALTNITSEKTKFYHVVAAIPPDVLKHVHDVIDQPSDVDCFKTLKSHLIASYTESETSKIRTLLQGIELGDQRPSTLLAKMHSLAGNHVSDDLLKSLWLDRLPTPAQAILAASNEQLSSLADMADKITEHVQFQSTVTSVSHPPASSLEQQVSALTTMVRKLSMDVHTVRTMIQRQRRPSVNRSSRRDFSCQNPNCSSSTFHQHGELNKLPQM